MSVESDVGPFAIVPEWVLRAGLSAGAVRLYAELALMADRKTGGSWPSRRTMADRLEVASLRTIDGYLEELETAGAVVKEARFDGEGGRRSSLYHVHYAARGYVVDATPPHAVDRTENQNQLEPEPGTREELAPPRPRDPIWDCLVEVYGEPTDSGRGARNAATKVLRDYGATPEEIAEFVTTLAGTDRDWAVTTPSALAKHFGERLALMAQVQNGRRKHDHAADLMREAMNE